MGFDSAFLLIIQNNGLQLLLLGCVTLILLQQTFDPIVFRPEEAVLVLEALDHVLHGLHLSEQLSVKEGLVKAILDGEVSYVRVRLTLPLRSWSSLSEGESVLS